MSSNPPATYDPPAFFRYYDRIGANLNNATFYKDLTDTAVRKELIDEILGVKDGRVNAFELYQNWKNRGSVLDMASRVFTIFLQDVKNFSVARANLQLMSSFLIHYYFNFKLSPTELLPRVVPYNRQGYFIQTDNLRLFFADDRVRGIGNTVIPGLCTGILSRFDDVEDQRTFVSYNPDLIGWCGCFSPPDPVMENLPLSDGGGENFPIQCDPLCVNTRAIKLFDINGSEVLQCNTAVCVLSDVSLNVEGSTSQRFNFNQVCTACDSLNPDANDTGEPCRCIIDSSFVGILGKVSTGDSGLDVQSTFKRYCPNSICILIDHATKVPQVLPCNEFNAAATGIGEPNYGTGTKTYTFETGTPKGFWGVIAMIMIVFIFLILGLLIKREVEVKVKYIKK